MTDQPQREDRLVKPGRVRRAVARVTSVSATVPQFVVERDVHLGPVLAFRRACSDRGTHLSVTDLLVAAVARALVRHPRINASWTDDGILERGGVHIGLAVAVDDGLLAPAIRDADRLSLPALARARQRAVDGALAGTLTAEDLMTATFTISNLGPYGITRFHALVLPPQAAILAVGAAQPSGALTLALTCDHRVIDGAPAALFLGDIAADLAEPAWLQTLLPSEDAA